MRERMLVAAAVAALTLLTYFQFPGHTFLQSDTQIYMPILERLWDSSVLGKDLIVERPHVSFTIYDEAALLLRKLSGAGFEQVLTAQQIVFRACGVWGLYLIAHAFGLPVAMSLLVAAILSLGATIGGPSVLTIEYEPVPRGFAVPMVCLAMGLAAQGRYLTAGIAAGVAFLYHAPTSYPFWAIYLFFARQRLRAGIPLAAASFILFVTAYYQHGATEAQPFFTRIGPEWEALQRMRASYNWISLWIDRWLAHYVFLALASALAVWRLWKFIPPDFRIFAVGLPVIGVLSMPASYILLEQRKWVLIPQAQPMRALLFLTLLAALLGAIAACRAAREGRWWEAVPWFALAYLVPANVRAWGILPAHRVWVILGLSALAALAAWLDSRGRPCLLVPAMLAAFFAIPHWAGIRNYPQLHTGELDGLAAWARASTPKESVFLFPDSGKDLDAGIFRARSLRTVYVDWKGGGQVNYFQSLGEEWWRRWQAALTKPLSIPGYNALGVDYVVKAAKNPVPERTPVFANNRYVVYAAH